MIPRLILDSRRRALLTRTTEGRAGFSLQAAVAASKCGWRYPRCCTLVDVCLYDHRGTANACIVRERAASSSLSKRITAATGPNIASCAMRLPAQHVHRNSHFSKHEAANRIGDAQCT
jgi:hypothetical protein